MKYSGETAETLDEYELPTEEALIAGTLALMTGYGQSLQAECDPMPRLAINLRIAENLHRLSQQKSLSAPFQALSLRLSALWQAMAGCTADACSGNTVDTMPASNPGCGRLH